MARQRKEEQRKYYEERGRYLQKTQMYVKVAKRQGVCFRVEPYTTNDTYCIRVVGESGVINGVPLRRLPALVHGLFLMGERLRAKRMSYEWYAMMEKKEG